MFTNCSNCNAELTVNFTEATVSFGAIKTDLILEANGWISWESQCCHDTADGGVYNDTLAPWDYGVQLVK